jgi:predicted porin
MHRKLMAVAVAGALAAPAIAVAQSTVQIYGRVTYEYGFADAGRDRPNTDYADTPGGSAIGFKGTETLGGGLSAWFQCETSADIKAFDKVGFCSRNSAVGFRGGFGNIFFGRWDTPMKRAMNIGTVGAEETGILGMSFLPFGGSGGSIAALGNGNTDTFGESFQRQRWKRREACLTTYETPRWGGFQVMGAFSCGNSAFDNGLTDADDNQKPRIYSAAVSYVNGPLGLGAAWEKHVDFGVQAPGNADLDDRGWGVSAAYTFAKNIKLGATYLDRKWETPTGHVKKKTWTVGVEWQLAGPHSIEAQYAWAGNSKGDSATGIGGNGGAEAPGGATGGDAWSLAYQYDFSKRTSVKLGYVRVDNDRNADVHRLGNTPALIGNGQNVDSWAFLIKHNF